MADPKPATISKEDAMRVLGGDSTPRASASAPKAPSIANDDLLRALDGRKGVAPKDAKLLAKGGKIDGIAQRGKTRGKVV